MRPRLNGSSLDQLLEGRCREGDHLAISSLNNLLTPIGALQQRVGQYRDIRHKTKYNLDYDFLHSSTRGT